MGGARWGRKLPYEAGPQTASPVLIITFCFRSSRHGPITASSSGATRCMSSWGEAMSSTLAMGLSEHNN